MRDDEEKPHPLTKEEFEAGMRKLPKMAYPLPEYECKICKTKGVVYPGSCISNKWGAFSPLHDNEYVCCECFIRDMKEKQNEL